MDCLDPACLLVHPHDDAPVVAPRTGYDLVQTYEVTGSVTHHAPCVPECPVCYPEETPS